MKNHQGLELSRFTINGGFIERYIDLIRTEVIPYQYDVLCDSVEGIEKSHVIKNFINAGRVLRGEDADDGFYGMVFQDSDAAKWLEAAAYSLVCHPDKALMDKADSLIDIIAQAQDTDGYLNTYYTIKDKDKRWTNLLEGHELYCAGHMMEAAVAYYEATGKKTLLDVMERNAEHIYRHFIIEKHDGCPGHPEVELALLKMYRATGNEHCLALAKHFIDVRGVDPDYFKKEVKSRSWRVWGSDGADVNYQQSGKPVREQSDATGHSVRAVYLYTAMADLASQTDDSELHDACIRLWESITGRRMYITGGIGSTVNGEAFTVDYDLPNDTAYAESCASIGLIFFASRMNEYKPDGFYADIMERAFYNTVLASMQLDGKRFFYVNPLEVIPGISACAVTHRHVLPERPSWYACACCPPNTARLISSFAKYAYGENETTSYCHMYAQGEVNFANGMRISCQTEYPYGFTVRYSIVKAGGTLALHIPQWSKKTSFTLNGSAVTPDIVSGYAYFNNLSDGDELILTLDDSIRKVYSTSRVSENTGCAAIERGPLVYCFEGVDNNDDILSLSLDENGSLAAQPYDSTLLGGTAAITADGYRTKPIQTLYSYDKPLNEKATLTAIPYYTWGNRGVTQMRVWLPER